MKKLLIIALCIGALTQCKKEDAEPEPQPAATPYTAPTGSIIGKVTQYNQYGVTYTTNLNNVTVGLQNTSISSVTDASGNYTLSNVPAGMYTMLISKPGGRANQEQQVNFPGSGTLYRYVNFTDSASFALLSGSIKDTIITGSPRFKVQVTHGSMPGNTSAIFVLSKTGVPNISNPGSYNFLFTAGISDNTTVTNYNYYLGASQLTSGVYNVKIYPFVSGASNGSTYHDYSTGKFIYTAYGTPLPATYTVNVP